MSSQGKMDDCYFYYYSSCTKGDECPFRHCQAALGTETVCSLWREGRCIRDNCKFRHMESRINRSSIQCYWEDQPSGCLKPHCVFMHRKPRFNIRTNTVNDGLILPISTTGPQTSPIAKVTEAKDSAKASPSNPVESYSTSSESELNISSDPIEPIVFSFDNEESDSESTSSTPMKSVANERKGNSISAKRNLSDNFSDTNNDLGIKTLEQIKMEKIHKESDNFYKLAYDALVIEPVHLKVKTDIFKTEIYPPQSDFIAISDNPPEEPVCVSIESSEHSPENERSIKHRILKRKSLALYTDKFQNPKKVMCLKKTKDDDPLDFKIKTLDEIRKEKQIKEGKKETIDDIQTPQNSTSVDSSIDEKANLESCNGLSETNDKSFRKLRIKRHSKDSSFDSSIVQEADSSSDSQKKERTQMILHEVQNISDEQNKVDLKGKRKGEDTTGLLEKNPKQMKTTSPSPPKTLPCSAKLIKNSRPVIKRKPISLNLPSSKITASSTNEEVSSTIIRNTELVTRENSNSMKVENGDNKISDSEKKTPDTPVDEIDNFLLHEADVTLDYEPDGSVNESDDILLEIEQLLDS